MPTATTPATDWLQGLADIETPAAPDWSTFYLLAGGIALLVCGAIAWGVWRRRRPARAAVRGGVALHRLAALQADWQRGAIDDRAAAYQLATILRLGLGLEQLPAQCPALPQISAAAWQTTLATLARYRYAPQVPDQLPPAVFATVRRWLQPAAGDGAAA